MNLKHELKGLAIAVLYGSYSILLGIFLYCYFLGGNQYLLIFNINKWGEATFELILLLISIPGLYYLWTEDLNKDVIEG